MIVLDAYAVLALLKGEPAASRVKGLLESRNGGLTVLGVAEVVDHLMRICGAEEDDAILDLAQLGLLEPPSLTPKLARDAGLLRARHYHGKNRAVSLADCVAAESARAFTASLATADPHLLALCHDENIEAIPLPDSRGALKS